MHFSVLVERGAAADTAYQYGRDWLSQTGNSPDDLDQSICCFWYFEQASTDVKKAIELHGYCIIPMEGCSIN